MDGCADEDFGFLHRLQENGFFFLGHRPQVQENFLFLHPGNNRGITFSEPLFQGGRIRSNYRRAWAQRDEAELTYKQIVLQAFGDVANSLVGYSQSRQYRMKIEEQTKTYQEMARLANVRFQGGVTSFLEVQYYEQQYFLSGLNLSQAWYTELANYVQLYQALGGGWDQQ